ncbi:MAG: hypothetical protein AAFN78_02500 [Pseudomonadota bacterium]
MRVFAVLSFALLLLPLAGAAQEAPLPQRGQYVGWVLPESYAKTPDAGDTFYPRGESSAQFNERIRILQRDVPGAPDADGYLSTLASAYGQGCPAMRTESLFSETVDGIDNAVQMWHCPARTDDGFGTVVLVKAIVDHPTIFLARASGRFPPYQRGASPLPESMLNNWAAFLNSFILCRNRLNPSCLPEPTELADAPVTEPAPLEDLAVELAQQRGTMMHRKDQLARRATEILGAQKSLRWKNKVRGWVTVLDEDGVDVVWFMGGSRRRPRPYYAIVFEPGGDGRFYDRNKYDASDRAIAMFRARESALAVMERACTASVNTVVLKHESNVGWLVYVLSAGTAADEVHIGGHTRYAVDEDGKRVLETETLSDSCLVLKKTPRNSADEPDVWYSMTHIQSPTPLETHLFQSLNHRLRFFVHTSSGDWRVEDGAINKLTL